MWGTWTWHCDVCGEPARQGVIEITDPKTGGYPRWSERDEQQAQKDQEAAWEALCDKYRKPGLDLVAIPFGETLPKRAPRVLINVYHGQCDPEPDGIGYCLQVEKHYDLREVLDSVAHLLGKVWFGKEEAKAFIRRFQGGKVARGRVGSTSA